MGVNPSQAKTMKSALLGVIFRLLFGSCLKYSYLCTVNEKKRNLRPNWATKIT